MVLQEGNLELRLRYETDHTTMGWSGADDRVGIDRREPADVEGGHAPGPIRAPTAGLDG
jgi:hypothetical protein